MRSVSSLLKLVTFIQIVRRSLRKAITLCIQYQQLVLHLNYTAILSQESDMVRLASQFHYTISFVYYAFLYFIMTN